MTTDENVFDWRGLTPALPADQAATLHRLETQLTAQGMEPAEVAAFLLESARGAITGATVATLCADIPRPPSATAVGDWERSAGGGWSRSLIWAVYGDPDGISVDVAGRQQHDGTYTQHINVWVEEGGALDAAAARWLAAQLMDAADLLDE